MGQDAPACPSCSAPLTGQDSCPACGLPLTGPAAAALWRIDVELANLQQHRERLLADRAIYLGALREAQSRGDEVPQRPLPYDVPLPPGAAGGHGSAPPAPASTPGSAAMPGWAGGHESAAAGSAGDSGAGPAAAGAPRRGLAGRTAQNLMLVLGGLLLAVAAIVFTVVTWGSMGIGGRAAILLGVTAALAYVPRPLRRRGLTATGETLALLAVGLFLLDCYAAQAYGLAGLDAVEGQAYWAVVTALTAVLAGGYARALGLRGAFAAAVLLSRFPLPLAAAAANLDAAGVATGLAATAALDLLLLRPGALGAVTGRDPARSDRAVITMAFLVSWVLGALTALLSGPETIPDHLIAAAILAVAAVTGAAYAHRGPAIAPPTAPTTAPPSATAPGAETPPPTAQSRPGVPPTASSSPADAVSGEPPLTSQARPAVPPGGSMGEEPPSTSQDRPAVPPAASSSPADSVSEEPPSTSRAGAGRAGAVAVGAGLMAISAPVMAAGPWLRSMPDAVVALAAVALVVLVASRWLSSRLESGARWAGAAVIGIGQLFALPAAVLAAIGPLPLEGEVWTGAPATARDTLPPAPEDVSLDVWTFHPSVLFAIGALAALLAARATRRAGFAYAGAGLALLGVLPVPFVARLPYAAALAVELVLCLAMLGLAAWARGPRAGWAVLAAYLLAPAPILLALADERATLVTLGVLAAASATCAALARHDLPSPGPGRAESDAASASPHPAATASGEASLSGSDASVSEAAPAARRIPGVGALTPHDWVRVVASVAAVFVLAGEAFAVARAAELSTELSGLAVLGVAALTVASAWARGRWAPVIPFWEAAGAVTAAAGILLTAGDPDLLDLALAGTGVLLLATALRPGRDRVWYAGAGFLLVAAWLRLWLEDVQVIEAYSLPFAVPALVIGWLRHRRRPELSSWAAYGSGLAGGLLPSLLVAVGDEDWVRPLLLGAAALTVAVLGARARSQAPALLGGGVLLIVVIRELAPEVAEVLSAVPRWVPIAIGGAVLLAVGTTFERRMRDLARLRDSIARMS
ncbi:MAG: hypothetical protein GEV11_09280 [Streptosporangiales bacterium]|nr:hypothetical protein [Streptosporangiales bacterium]